jgi:hypothetical protein
LHHWKLILGSLLVAVALPEAATAQTPELGWSWSAQLTAVWSGGNSESSTFGLGSTLRRIGERNELKLEAGGIRSDASVKTRRAVGTAASHTVEETEESRKTAESYSVRGRYGRTIGNGFLFFTGADWSRNTFAGVDGRTLLAAGLGRLWAERDDFRFKTDLAATYSFTEDVVENPFVKSSFPGVRFSWDLMRTLTSTTKWESTLIADMNIDETDDVRVDVANAVSVTVSSRVALKPGLQLFWRNQPALTEVNLFTPAGAPTGQGVLVPLEKLDTLFTLALVVTL